LQDLQDLRDVMVRDADFTGFCRILQDLRDVMVRDADFTGFTGFAGFTGCDGT